MSDRIESNYEFSVSGDLTEQTRHAFLLARQVVAAHVVEATTPERKAALARQLTELHRLEKIAIHAITIYYGDHHTI